MLYLKVVFFVVTIGVSCLSFSQPLTDKVVAITDGDTFKMLTADSTLVKVRLANIDCPEKKQPFSAKAKEFTADAIVGKQVAISVVKSDRYNRYISNVRYNETLSLSHELVKNGYAWHFVKYSKDSTLQALENEARQQKRGLWQDANPIVPWEWRARKKKKKP